MTISVDAYGRKTKLVKSKHTYACMECGHLIYPNTQHMAVERDSGMPQVRYCCECRKHGEG
jgi:hypothetical protein